MVTTFFLFMILSSFGEWGGMVDFMDGEKTFMLMGSANVWNAEKAERLANKGTPIINQTNDKTCSKWDVP